MRFRDSWNVSAPIDWAFGSGVHVDLGCGSTVRNPFRAKSTIGVDILEAPQVVTRSDFTYRRTAPGQPLPLEDSSVDSVSAYDFIEHIPRFDRLPDGTPVNPFIELMNEIHRVLRPGGILVAVTPCYPSPSVFVDPTHVNVITPLTHEYFCEPTAIARNLGYGFTGSFNALSVQWVKPWSPVWRTEDQDPETRFGQWSGLVRMIHESARTRIVHPVKFIRDAVVREKLLWVWECRK